MVCESAKMHFLLVHTFLIYFRHILPGVLELLIGFDTVFLIMVFFFSVTFTDRGREDLRCLFLWLKNIKPSIKF